MVDNKMNSVDYEIIWWTGDGEYQPRRHEEDFEGLV